MPAHTRTYSSHVALPDTVSESLTAYATLFSRAVRTAYAQQERAVRSKQERTKAERKATLAAQFHITSRQSNAVLLEADAKRSAILELYKLQVTEVSERLRKGQSRLKDVQKLLGQHAAKKTLKLSPERAQRARSTRFYLQTKIARWRSAQSELKAAMAAGRTSLTFGTKAALRQRSSGLTRKELHAWRAEWDRSRNGQFLVLGSKDETGGCQGCVATENPDGSFNLRVRMPDGAGGGFVVVPGVQFAYGAEHLRHALQQQTVRSESKAGLTAAARSATNSLATETGTESVRAKVSQRDIQGGLAITWRFMRQADGRWRISFSVEVPMAAVVTSLWCGAIGVDLNSGFLTMANVDRFGNIKWARNLSLPEVGRSAEQRKAALGDAVKQVIALCVAQGKPLVLEDLDFQAKKRDLRLRNPNSRRKLASLAYNATHELLCARAQDNGVEVILVNPAYTSTQGQVRYAAQRGWTTHQAAAGVIARRGLGMQEAAPVSGTRRVPVGDTAVEWAIPADIARSDVYHRWPLLHQHPRRTITSYFRAQRRVAQPGACRGRQGEPEVAGEIPASKRAYGPPLGG